jgi:poly(A) polymerase Pap1
MSRYSIDEEQHSFQDSEGDCKIHLDTVQEQRSMRDGPFLKQAIRYVGIELLTRERLISEQKKELALPCS